MALSKKVSPGQIGVIAFNTQLVVPKEKKLEKPEEVTNSEKQNVIQIKEIDKTDV